MHSKPCSKPRYTSRQPKVGMTFYVWDAACPAHTRRSGRAPHLNNPPSFKGALYLKADFPPNLTFRCPLSVCILVGILVVSFRGATSPVPSKRHTTAPEHRTFGAVVGLIIIEWFEQRRGAPGYLETKRPATVSHHRPASTLPVHTWSAHTCGLQFAQVLGGRLSTLAISNDIE